jgi:hypothetical protein
MVFHEVAHIVDPGHSLLVTLIVSVVPEALATLLDDALIIEPDSPSAHRYVLRRKLPQFHLYRIVSIAKWYGI